MRNVPIANRACRSTVLHLGLSWGAALVVLGVAAPAAAQYVDPKTCIQGNHACDVARKAESDKAAAYEQAAQQRAARREKLRRLPPIPDERNVLLGSWRLEGRETRVTGLGERGGTGRTDAVVRELWATLQSNPNNMFCTPMVFGHGITFASSTYSIQALDGSVSRSSIDYRSTEKQVIVAIPDNMNMDLDFRIEGPNRILFQGNCALVRVGAPTAHAAANTTAAPGNTRTAAASPSALPPAGMAPQVASPPLARGNTQSAIASSQLPSADSATPTVAASLARKPIEPISRLGRGVQLHGQKDFQQALQQLLVAAQSDPNDPRVFVYLADTYAWLGMDAQAKQAAERAKQLDPKAFEILR